MKHFCFFVSIITLYLLFHFFPPVVVFLFAVVTLLQAGDCSQGLGAESTSLHEHLTEMEEQDAKCYHFSHALVSSYT